MPDGWPSFAAHHLRTAQSKLSLVETRFRALRKQRGDLSVLHSASLKTDHALNACIFDRKTDALRTNCNEITPLNTFQFQAFPGRNCAPRLRGNMNPTWIWSRENGPK